MTPRRCRTLGQSKNALIGQIATLGQPRDGRHTSMAAGRNHGAGKREGLPLDVEGTRTGETTMAEKDIHAQVP